MNMNEKKANNIMVATVTVEGVIYIKTWDCSSSLEQDTEAVVAIS